MPKTIHTVLYDGDINGSKMITMDNCVCQLFIVNRNDDLFVKDFSDYLSHPALYFLLNPQLKKAYIGETNNFQQRFTQHKAAKKFWTVAIAFHASDGSLTDTEVKYLEAKAYEEANNANNYDLSENGQVPQSPYIQIYQRLQADEYFEYVKLLAKFVGCDIFDHKVIETNLTAFEKPLVLPLNSSVTQEQLRGRIRLSLNGEGQYSKRVFVHAVVKAFMEKYPEASFAQLRATFNRDLLGNWSKWELLQDNLDYAKSLPGETGHGRYLIGDEHVLTSSDGVKFVVCTEWDYTNLPAIIGIAEAIGCHYSIINEK